jgi:hypothetical protein
MKRSSAKLIKKHSDITIRKGECLASFHIEVCFASKRRALRKVEITRDAGNANRLPLPTDLVRYLLESGIITKPEVQSLLPKARAGRKPITLNKLTGKIEGNMNFENKQVVELWNAGKEPHEIRAAVFPELRSDPAKREKTSKILRILRRNKRLLTRSYITSVPK